MRFGFAVSGTLVLAGSASAHLTAFANGMYCRNGTIKGFDNQNNNDPVNPMWNLPKKDWWFHHTNQCDEFPPAPGEFLEIPAGGSFTVEIASNRAFTTLSYNSKYTSQWPDGAYHPDGYSAKTPGGAKFSSEGCITAPNMHTQNQSMAAGTAFAISYQSDISKVTAENLAVFSVRYHTPWKRITSYDVPANMPACPAGGCICAWGWVPNGCGEPNMYMAGYKCKVTGARSTTPIATAKPPVWCEDDTSKCVKGAKQMIYWHQMEGNNIEVQGYDLSGHPKSPGYNNKLGFSDGAQNDIFASVHTPLPKPSTSASSPSSSCKPGGKKRQNANARRLHHHRQSHH